MAQEMERNEDGLDKFYQKEPLANDKILSDETDDDNGNFREKVLNSLKSIENELARQRAILQSMNKGTL